jgi:poly(hydroxyalkanoate) depolymerase family esterase
MFRDIDMKRLAQLARDGRLAQAMAVLRGESGSPETASPRPDPAIRKNVIETLQGALGSIARRSPLDGLDDFEAPKARRAPPPAPEGARFERRVFSNQAGSRDYKLYVPSAHAGGSLPLIVMLHGCTQSPDDFAAGTRMNELAEEHRFLVAYPAQARTANVSKCWNWFSETDQQRDLGEPSLIAGITREIMRSFPVAPGRVYVAGLSAGGAAAAIMGSAYPDLYAAVGVHSGLAYGAASDMASAFKAMRQGANSRRMPARRSGARIVPTIVFHGDRDSTVNPVNADHVIAQSDHVSGLRVAAKRGAGPDGVSYTRTTYVDAVGRSMFEKWDVHGLGHAWSGGSPAGSYTEPSGPDASREMLRFFFQH